ncbi:uncharacterized RING finger protein P4H10.07-like [Cryptomeria japonica]|uniref:uncharacterized RING finger protein P4H10.07-like n=1 Tax=Cryptomeria japonica TaxID=3369 RepID=UPI0027DAABF1|nr:uncharacterized RING finger protein P4H10.07-like [Cryptomeria japonica]
MDRSAKSRVFSCDFCEREMSACDYEKENGPGVLNTYDKGKENNVGSSQLDSDGQNCQTNLLGENPNALSKDGNPCQHSAEREKNNGQRLDWCCLLQDLDSSKADLAWHIYLQKAPRVDMQVVLNDKDKELISGNSKDGEETRCVDNGPANLVLPQPSQKCFNEGDAWCCICHSSILEMGEWKQLLQLPCGHGYHSECIAKWLGANNTCPLCRYQLPSCS